ncbi:hypothetical protein PoB_004999800 [Plakobranchus ocellatus]|uniref:Uncharacterized protein n=1 Tax=Plakobranchus ocellatus TaxID=259542 RepID=A0AAV4BWC0_9GAST|nr:hypothetical protein PoB_004999800 [Plakobranchus ocellatus]
MEENKIAPSCDDPAPKTQRAIARPRARPNRCDPPCAWAGSTVVTFDAHRCLTRTESLFITTETSTMRTLKNFEREGGGMVAFRVMFMGMMITALMMITGDYGYDDNDDSDEDNDDDNDGDDDDDADDEDNDDDDDHDGGGGDGNDDVDDGDDDHDDDDDDDEDNNMLKMTIRRF